MQPGGPIVLGELVSGVEIILWTMNSNMKFNRGEICIRGPCLAVDCLNDEQRTQEKFFFRNGVRHYRTGDLARRNADDSLSFVARIDRIIKNRGCLVNLETEVSGVVVLRCDSLA